MIATQSRFVIAAGFFVVWVGILYAGADHPPPLGFIRLVLLCLLAAGIVYLRVPTYLVLCPTGLHKSPSS